MAKLFSDGDFADSDPAAVLSESDFADSGEPGQVLSESDFADSPGQDKGSDLRKRLKQKDSLLNKIGYVKNRTKEDKPDAEGLTLDDYRNFVTSSDFNTLDDERLNLVAQAVDAKHADVSKKRGIFKIAADSVARGIPKAIYRTAEGRMAAQADSQENRDTIQSHIDAEAETDVNHPRAVSGVKDIRGVGDALKLAVEVTGENVGNAVAPMAAGASGAKIGALAGPTGALVGGMVGAGAGALAGNLGEAVRDHYNDTGKAGTSVGVIAQGLGYSAIDAALGGEATAVKHLFKGVSGETLKAAKKNFVGSIGKAVLEVAKGGAKGGLGEALQSQGVGRTRRYFETGSALEKGESGTDALWAAADEFYGGFFSDAASSSIGVGAEYSRNKTMLKRADVVISKLSADKDVDSIKGFDKKLVSDYMLGMAAMPEVDAGKQDIIRAKQAEIMDAADGQTKAVLNAYQSMFTDASFDNIPDTVKPTFNAQKAYESKIDEQDGSETYFDADSGIMIQGREGSWSVFNRNGMKMPLTEENNVKTIKDAIGFAQNLTRLNQWRVENNQAKSEFIQKLAEKNHPGANVVMVDSPLQIKDEGIRSRFIGNEQGFYNPGDNTVYMMLDAVQNPAQAAIVLNHEDFHSGFDATLKATGKSRDELLGKTGLGDNVTAEEYLAEAYANRKRDPATYSKATLAVQKWIGEKTGIRSLVGDAEMKLLIQKVSAQNKERGNGAVEYQQEGQSDANQIRYDEAMAPTRSAQAAMGAEADASIDSEAALPFGQGTQDVLVDSAKQQFDAALKKSNGDVQKALKLIEDSKAKVISDEEKRKSDAIKSEKDAKEAELFRKAIEEANGDMERAKVIYGNKLNDSALSQNAVAPSAPSDQRQPAQEAAQSTPTEPVTSAPVVERKPVEAAPYIPPAASNDAEAEQTTSLTGVGGKPYPTIEIPLDELSLSKDVPQFKENADSATGEVEPIEGQKYERVGTAPIVVWERTDGRKEIITGRHRAAFARRVGEKSIPAQVVREVDGFTKSDAITFDAESNIRDGQGSVKDYANYFRNTNTDLQEASSRGLLGRDKGRKGFSIGKYASDDLYSVYRDGKINDSKAAAISESAPNNPGVQQVGIRYAEKHNAEETRQYMRSLQSMRPPEQSGQQLDLLGFDTSWQETADNRASAAVRITSRMNEELSALKAAKSLSAEKRNEIVKKYGVKAGNEKAIAKRIEDLTLQVERFNNWHLNPDLVKMVAEEAREKTSEVSAAPVVNTPTVDAKNNGSLFDEKALPFNLDGGTQDDVVRIAAEKKADEDRQAEAKRKLDAAPVLPGVDASPVKESLTAQVSKPISENQIDSQTFKRGTKVATTRNADGISYFGEVLQSNPDGTVKIRAFKEKTKGTIAAKTYGVDKAGNRVTKDVDVPAESVKSVDATADTSKLTDEERRKLKMAEAVDAANADNELRKGRVEAPRDLVDSFNSANERKEQRKTDNGLRFRRSNVTSEQDAEYLDAVKRGDLEAAQRMVDEAAKAAGDIRSRHATGAEPFSVFNRDKISRFDPDTNIRGFHFSNEATESSSYRYQNTSKNRVLDVYLRLGRVIKRRDAQRMVSRGEAQDGFPNGFDTVVFRESSGAPSGADKEAYERGERVDLANGYFVRKDSEGGANLYHASEPNEIITGYSDLNDAFAMHNEEHYVVRNPAQIKSADAVTYDDAGNVIPLSERFNEASDDIRFRRSMAGTPSGADILDTETGLQAARRIVQDYMQPWERKQEALQKALKRKLSDDVDVYRAEDDSYGLVWDGVQQFEKNFIDKAVKTLKNNGLTVEEFDQFLMAKAGPDRNKMIADRTDGKNLTGSGQSDVYWNNILAAYRKQGKYDKLNEAAEHVWALNRAVLDMKVEAGLMSKAQADVWKTKSPFYVPLRSDDAEADYKELGKRASFSLKRKESKSATGRAEGHEADTPFAFSVMQSLEAVGRANKNVVYETAAKLIEQNPSDLWHIEKRIPTKHAYDADTGKVISVPDAQFEDATNVVIVKRDGKKQYLVFEGADGLKLARSLKKDSLQKAPVIVSALTRTYAMMRTAMVPTFILRNLRADILQLAINMTAEAKSGMVPEVFKSIPSAWKAVYTYERDGKAKGALAGYANEFFGNGGKIAGVGAQTVDKINQTLNKHVKKHGKFMTHVGMPALSGVEYIERLNASIETGTRIALYTAMRKRGFSIRDSIEAGKNITVNFNRKGELGPYVNSFYMFSNVAVQDAARSVKAITGKNGKAVVLGLLGAGFLGAMLNNGDDDEEDKTGAGNYKNIPESDKQRNIIIKVGGKYVKQPIRGIWAWIYYAGTKAGDVAFGKYDSARAAVDVSAAALDTINFLGASGSVTQFMVPTIVDPFIQHGENRDWKGSPIYQRKFTEAQPDSSTGMKRTPNWMKSTAKGLNRLTGGDDATKGMIDVAPETIKFVIDTMAGGIGTDLSYGTSFVADAAKGEFDVDKTPVVRDAIRDLPDSTSEYYRAKDRFDAGVYAVNHYKTAKERSAYYRENPFMKPSLADRIKELHKTIKELREKESKTEVKERKATLEARRLRLQSTVLRLMSEGASK